MSEDAIGFAGEDTNLYRYVKNHPVGLRDPFGYEAGILSGGLGNGLVDGLIGVVGATVGVVAGVAHYVTPGTAINTGIELGAEVGRTISRSQGVPEELQSGNWAELKIETQPAEPHLETYPIPEILHHSQEGVAKSVKI